MATSPYTRHLQLFVDGMAPDVRRSFGDIQNAQPAPAKAQQLATGLMHAILSQLEATLNKTHHPVYMMPETAPDTGWMVGFADRRGLTHGRNLGAFACLMENGQPTWAGFLDLLEGRVGWAMPGEGAHNGKRLRVSGREKLADGIALLPWQTKAVIQHNLMQKAADANVHTRKMGTPVQDALALAAGQADVLINMSLPPAELFTMYLFMREAGAIVTDAAGQQVSLESDNLLAANPNLHRAALQAFAE